MARFFIFEKKQPKLGNGTFGKPEMVQREISFGEAIEASDGFYRQLMALEKEYPSVRQEFEKVDSQCIEAGRAVQDALSANSPTLKQARLRLRDLAGRRDGILYFYKKRRQDLLSLLEKLSSPLINEVGEEWLIRRKELSKKLEVRRIREVRFLDKQPAHVVVTNRRAIKGILDFLLARRASLLGMRAEPLSKVFDFIRETETELAKFNPLATQEEQVDEQAFKNLKEAEKQAENDGKGLETGYVPPGGGDIIQVKKAKPEPEMEISPEETLDLRLRRAKEKFRPEVPK